MTTLRQHLDRYLTMRRALGFGLHDLERQVGLFITWLEAQGQEQSFTIEQAVTWARLNPDAHPSWWATRLSLVRRFAVHLHATGVDVPIIPTGLLPARKPRAVPFIYTQDDIDALQAACVSEFPDERIAATVGTVIGLLACTGLRISEALNLTVDDIDTEDDVLRIKAAKSGERLVPIHPTTTAALKDYLALPARALPARIRTVRSSSPPRAPGTSTSPSSPCSNVPARLPGSPRAGGPVPDFMICGTASPPGT